MEPHPKKRLPSLFESSKPASDTSPVSILECEASFRAAFEASGIGMAICSTEGRWLRVNESLCNILGYSREELVGIAFIEITHPDDIELSIHHYRQIFDREVNVYHLEKRYIHADGHAIWAKLTVSSVFDPNGKLLFYVSQIEDVTEHKRLERELKAVNERLALATRAGGVGVWDWDLANDHLSWDAQMCALYGISADQFSGKIDALGEWLHTDDIAEYFERLRETLHNGEPFNLAFRVVQPTGKIRHLRAFATVERNSKGKAIRVVGTNWDITAAVQQKEDLLRLAEQAKQASLAKSQFLANVSHEIRTPLNGVIGMTHLLLDMKGLTDAHRDTANLILSSSESLMTLINQILDFSKAESGKLELDIHRFNLRALIRQLSSPLSLRAAKVGIEFRTNIDRRAPQRLNGDSGKLKQVIQNLVDNAIKFTQQGEVRLSVNLLKQTTNHVILRIAIKDSGIGIAPDVQKRLFNAFTQADASTTRIYGGTGLGLAISKEIVELMDGEIGVHSGIGQGSEFWFTARLEIAPETASGFPGPFTRKDADSTTAEEVETKLRRHSAQALLAEDNRVNQLVARGMLDRLGITVDTASNGLEAIERCRQKQYDVIFMDIQMPEVDGLEATLAIREWEAGQQLAATPIIAMTAHARPEDRRACLAAGMNACLVKPLCPDTVAEIVDSFLDNPGSPTNQPDDALCVLDIEELERRLGEDSSLIREVLSLSMKELKTHVRNYQQLRQEESIDDAMQCLHAIVGVASSSGFSRLANAAAHLENHLNDHQEHLHEDSAPDLSIILKESLSAAISYLATYPVES
ncbi:PAS domain S-box protein [Cerasicoccus maritimus]|uniref:PAS domain S-box protein n=1 Tax=Cerasicoccus maritimus TaxID=490089 RepID=UPI0028529E9E|nr:PAS domain S-box protein [Cerasicoccus maritimus]